MASNNTPNNKKTAENRRSSTSPATDDNTLSPLGQDSFSLAPQDSRTSNPRFGPVGGPNPTNRDPGFVLFASHSQLAPAVRHAASLADLRPSSTQRSLQPTQPGRSYVTDLPSWRRGAGQPAPTAAPRDGPRREPRRDEGRPAGFDGRVARYQEEPPNNQGPWRGPPQPRELFRPMNVKLDPAAANRPLSKEDKEWRDDHGISYNYKGDATNPANESANIPDHLNCSVWVTQLPRDCTYRDLLRAVAVHTPGKVFATVINPPKKPENWRQARLPSSYYSAAKITFYYPHSARYLINIAAQGRFLVREIPARVIPNKIKVAPQPYPNRTSRCVQIRGPANVVNEAALTRLFNRFFWWETEEVVVLWEGYPPHAPGIKFRTIEWRFASHQAQASSAYHTIVDHGAPAAIRWSQDPCHDLLTDQMYQITLGQQGQQGQQ